MPENNLPTPSDEKNGVDNLKEGQSNLPNGCRLYWKTNEVGGRTYFSDEIGGGVYVWDTALVGDDTLLSAITEENRMRRMEAYLKDRLKR